MEKQTFATVATPAATGDEPETTISTIALDRAQDEVVPEGGDFSAYRRNPVVLFAHTHDTLPVGSTTQIDVIAGRGIRARWRWLENDPFADRVRNAYEQGVIRAASIGFIPLESERNGHGGRRFTKWSLCEWSLCPVPANPEAVRTLKNLNLWADDEVVLDLTDDDEVVLELVDPVPDRAARGHRRVGAGELLDVTPDEVRRAIADVVPRVLADELKVAVAREIEAELLRRRGRID